MKKIITKFKGLFLFESNRFKDSRGYFRELFLEKKNKKKNNLLCFIYIKKKCYKRTSFSRKKFTG